MTADWWGLRGEALQLQGDFREAYTSYRRAHARLTAAGDSWRLAEITLRLGDTARQLERFKEALRWYAAAKKYANAASSLRLALDASTGEGMALRGLGRYPDALRAFSTLLATYRRRRDREGAAYILWAMGSTARFAGRLASAARHLRAAAAAYGKLGDASGLAYARCGWGGTLRMMGYAEQSRRLYAQAYGTFQREGDRFGMAYSSCGQGNGFRMSGHLSKALPFMARAERGYRALRLHGPLGFVLWSRAQLLIERGDWLAAKRQLTQARTAFEKSNDPRGLVYVALGVAELARAQGKSFKPAFRRAGIAARRLHLSLEETHARVRSGEASISAYRSLGVSIRDFSRYRSLP